MPGRKILSKPALLAIVVVLLLAVVAVLYLQSVVSALIGGASTNSTQKASVPFLSANVSNQDLLYSGSQLVNPYLLVKYSVLNTSMLNMSVSIFSSKVPRAIYILNSDNECFDCGNTGAIDSAIASDLLAYGIVNSSSNVHYLDISNLNALPPYAILVVLNGLLPSAFLAGGNSSVSPIMSMLNRGASIIYVGQNFSRSLVPGSVVVPSDLSRLAFLDTSIASHGSVPGYYFNSSTFSLKSGTSYGSMSYENVSKGWLVVFPNSPSSWSSAGYAGHDIAEAIRQLFWLTKYSGGSVGTNNIVTSGSFGVTLSPIPLYLHALSYINNGTIVLSIEASNPSTTGQNTTYEYLYFKPHFMLNGSILVPSQIVPGSTVSVTMTVATHGNAQTSIQPHITVYALNNMTPVGSIPLPFSTASGNFTFINYINFGVGPGTYIAELQSFTNGEYAASMFNVSQINVKLVQTDIAKGVFTFNITSLGHPLSNINYTISINGAYPASGVLSNGTLSYTLPSGTPAQQGNSDFEINLLGQTLHYAASSPSTAIVINKDYIELGIVGFVCLLMVVLIRAPNRDEFYIDVQSLPSSPKTAIKLKPNEILSAFSKLNTSYHWRFMPLSAQEIHAAILTNIRFNNMPVSLTYANISLILDKLIANNSLVRADNLYAPKDWETLSKHDIEYLSTFKKLRLFLVTHAYVFTDLDMSNSADIVATIRGDRRYIVIYSDTSKFKDMPVFAGSKTYLTFLNASRLDEFKIGMYRAVNSDAEVLKAYVSAGMVCLVDADNPAEMLG